MNFKGCAAALLAALVSIPAVADAGTGVYRLENGMSVLVSDDSRFPLASVRLFVKAGSAWERPDEAGLSHMLEHMVFKGSATSGDGVDRKVENAGGSMNAYTSYDMTTYLADLPSSRWRQAMEAVRDLAFDPLLRREDLDAEREVVIAEKRQRGDSPMTRLFQAAMARTLKGTPYETPVIGTEKALRALTPDMMRDYIRRRYDPRDMVLSVAGDVKPEDVVAEAGRLFGSYVNRNVLQPVPRVDPASLAHGFSADVAAGPWKKAFVSFSFPLPDANDGLMPAADVLAHLLAGDDTSLLPRLFRIERPVVDDVEASAMGFERTGIFMVTAQLDPEKAEGFLRDLAGRLSTLKAADFTDEQISRAVLNIEDGYWRGLEKIADVAEVRGREYFQDPVSLGGARYLSGLHGMDRAAIQAVLDRWIVKNALSVCALVPKSGGKGISAALAGGGAAAAVNAGWKAGSRDGTQGSGARSAAPSAGREVVDLGGGRRVVLIPDATLPYVSADLSFSGGESLVPDGHDGLGSAAAGVLAAATKGRPFQAMNVYEAERAAGLGASCGLSSFSLKMDAPERFAGDMFRLMREVVLEPAFDEADVERVRRELLAAIASREESATGVMGRELRHFLFRDGPLSHRPGGSREVLASVTSGELKEFWERQKAMPWVLSVAGRFSRDEVLEFAGGLPKPEHEAVQPPMPDWNGTRTLECRLPGRDQAVYLMVFPTVGSDSEDRQALRLLSECLDGFTGRLYRRLREEQSLGYSVFPVDWADRKTGFLGFGVVAAPGNLPKAREAFLKIAAELKSDLLPEETLARAKAVAEADFHKARQGRAFRAEEAAFQVLNDRPLDYAQRRLEEMKRIDAEQLRRIAGKYLSTDGIRELVVKP